MTKTDFETVIRPVLTRATVYIDKALEEVKWERKDVDTVLLVGGRSKIFLFRNIIKQLICPKRQFSTMLMRRQPSQWALPSTPKR